jgi:hypothetical protein
MYHPELYPELAKNNMTPKRLTIKQKVSNKQIKPQLNIQVIKAGTVETKLDQLVTDCANNKQIKTYTAKYQIEPILDEISEVGRTYFGLKTVESDTMQREIFIHDKVVDNTYYENPLELYYKKLDADSLSVPDSLRVMLKNMQDRGDISKSYDLTSIPYELQDSKNIVNRGKNSLVDRRNQIIVMMRDELPLVEREMLRRELKSVNSALMKLKQRFEEFEKRENKDNIIKLIREKYRETKGKKNSVKKSIKI